MSSAAFEAGLRSTLEESGLLQRVKALFLDSALDLIKNDGRADAKLLKPSPKLEAAAADGSMPFQMSVAVVVDFLREYDLLHTLNCLKAEIGPEIFPPEECESETAEDIEEERQTLCEHLHVDGEKSALEGLYEKAMSQRSAEHNNNNNNTNSSSRSASSRAGGGARNNADNGGGGVTIPRTDEHVVGRTEDGRPIMGRDRGGGMDFSRFADNSGPDAASPVATSPPRGGSDGLIDGGGRSGSRTRERSSDTSPSHSSSTATSSSASAQNSPTSNNNNNNNNNNNSAARSDSSRGAGGGARASNFPADRSMFPSTPEKRPGARGSETTYVISNMDGGEFVRYNQVTGQQVVVDTVKNSRIIVLDHIDSSTMDFVENCEIVVVACEQSFFIRDCKNCTFYVACKQLRTRDCEDCRIHLFTTTDPVVESSERMHFYPYNIAAPHLAQRFQSARIDPRQNRFIHVYDFTRGDAGDHFFVHWPDHEDTRMIRVGEAIDADAIDSPPEIEMLLRHEIEPASSLETGKTKSLDIKTGAQTWQKMPGGALAAGEGASASAAPAAAPKPASKPAPKQQQAPAAEPLDPGAGLIGRHSDTDSSSSSYTSSEEDGF